MAKSDQQKQAEWLENFYLAFGDIPDPRKRGMVTHQLMDIIIMTVAAVLAGAEAWTEVQAFGKCKEAWLRTFLPLPGGIPSHDTIGRVFALLDTDALTQRLARWVAALRGTKPEHIAIDGKALRGSRDDGREAIHMVSAYARAGGITLGQVVTEEKSNEITAIPKVLDLVNLKGCTVTIDAMGCQVDIARRLRSKGANFVLALKENWPLLHEEVRELFDDEETLRTAPHFVACDKGHGRVEERTCVVVSDVSWIRRSYPGWEDVKAVVMVLSKRRRGKAQTNERRFYLASFVAEPQEYLDFIRGHWAIENSLHWVLDVVFGEDASRVRSHHAAANFGIIRRMALNTIRQGKSRSASIRGTRKMAAWDDGLLEKLLAAFGNM
jgi:predicted transposase YbfD/YdcC